LTSGAKLRGQLGEKPKNIGQCGQPGKKKGKTGKGGAKFFYSMQQTRSAGRSQTALTHDWKEERLIYFLSRRPSSANGLQLWTDDGDGLEIIGKKKRRGFTSGARGGRKGQADDAAYTVKREQLSAICSGPKGQAIIQGLEKGGGKRGATSKSQQQTPGTASKHKE